MLVVTGPEGPHNPANAAYQQRLYVLRDELGLRGAAHFVAEHAPGFLPDPVVADFFRLADALVLPSREEGFGIPLIEAAVSRLPVFCADIPALRELGEDQVTYFSPDANPAWVAETIAARLQRDPIYGFGVRARQGYNWDRIYLQHLAPLLAA
jgi:glycosyltransferase involved in cell wall biosynthesis